VESAERTNDVPFIDTIHCLIPREDVKGSLIIRLHKIFRCLIVFIRCPASKTLNHGCSGGTETEADALIISTRIQQGVDKPSSGFLIYYSYSEVQRCVPLEPVNRIHVAFFFAEDVFQHVKGVMRDTDGGVSCRVEGRM
jgi:hypothetical protein